MRSMNRYLNILFSLYDSTYGRAAKKASQKNFMTATLATAMMMTGRPHAMSCIYMPGERHAIYIALIRRYVASNLRKRTGIPVRFRKFEGTRIRIMPDLLACTYIIMSAIKPYSHRRGGLTDL